MFGIMDTQTTTARNFLSQLVCAPAAAPACTPQSLGYEIAGAELASELAAAQYAQPLTADGAALPAVDPDEFDAVYKWFIA